jgi:hypothetical protein
MVPERNLTIMQGPLHQVWIAEKATHHILNIAQGYGNSITIPDKTNS